MENGVIHTILPIGPELFLSATIAISLKSSLLTIVVCFSTIHKAQSLKKSNTKIWHKVKIFLAWLAPQKGYQFYIFIRFLDNSLSNGNI